MHASAEEAPGSCVRGNARALTEARPGPAIRTRKDIKRTMRTKIKPVDWFRGLRSPASRISRRRRSRCNRLQTESLEGRLLLTALPTNTQAWESVPGVIRADGVETFRVEVEVPRAVNGVTIDLFPGAPLLPSNSGTITLVDDGQNGDRVAHDGIYTSSEFWYDTSRPWWPLSQHLPGSPESVNRTDIGDIFIHETDGTVNQMLGRAMVGLLRADVQDVVATEIAPDMVTTEHLINVSTEHRDTQRLLRGGSNVGAVPQRLSNRIYQEFPDDFDFLNTFSTNKIEFAPRLTSANFHAGIHGFVKKDFTGNSVTPFDFTEAYGSDGRLQAINVVDVYDRGMNSANLTHEMIHQWSGGVDLSLPISNGSHFDYRSSVGSLLGGQQWTDNGDGTFTVNMQEGRNGATHAAPLDLYMMGLIDAADVPDMFKLKDDVPFNPFTDPIIDSADIEAVVTIEDIIAIHGPRTPGPGNVQTDFNLGFVAESHNRLLTATELTYYDIFAAHYTSDVAADEPDPYVGFGWTSISRFFGNGTTWSSDIPTPLALTADIIDVSATPIATAVDTVTITFSDAVSGLDLNDLVLSREGGPNLLTAQQSLTTSDNTTWTLGNLNVLTTTLGEYELTLSGDNSGISRISDGRPLLATVGDAWFKAPTVSLGIDNATIDEAGGTTTITAQLSEVSPRDVLVDFEFSGTATYDPRYVYYPTDFLPSESAITIPAGAVSATITLTSVQDRFHEADQSVVTSILSASNAVIASPSQVTTTIIDDEADPVVTWVSRGGQNTEGGAVAVAGILSVQTELEITIDVAFGGTATKDGDYVVDVEQITIPPMSTSGDINISLLDDAIDEPTETVSVTVQSVTNATLGNNDTITMSLYDNDDPPEVTLTIDSSEIAETSGEATVTAELTAPSGYDVLVDLAFDGTALLETDYSASSSQIIIPAGQQSASVTLAATDDAFEEDDETIIVEIASVANAVEQGTQQVTTTILDNDAPTFVHSYADQQKNRFGTITGDITDTHGSDNQYQVLTETPYRNNTRSRLKHRWTFDVAAGSSVMFVLEAHHNSALDDFVFEYSTGGGSGWTTMLTVEKTSDDDTTQVFAMPADISGKVHVRVKDTNRSRHDGMLDSLFIDDMHFLTTL